MQRKGVRRQGAVGEDVESALDELYTTPPPRFVARREELAAAARAGGRAEDARRIHAARRPSLAAWAANLLLRSEPQESRRFLELGRALREAYSGMDSAGVKELSVRRRRVVSELNRQAVRIALDAGHRLSGAVQQEIEATLHAVLTDPAAAEQWAGGRLETALVPPSQFVTDMAPSAGAPPEPTRPKAAPASPGQKDELAEQRRERQRRLARARTAAKNAEQRLRTCREQRSASDAALTQARGRRDLARQRMSEAERHLREAREELQRTAEEEREAEERSQGTAEALARAEREARAAAEEVDRLSGRTRG
jgi:hypothetical protein